MSSFQQYHSFVFRKQAKRNVKRNLFSFTLIVNDVHQFNRRKQRKKVLLYGTSILIRIDIHHWFNERTKVFFPLDLSNWSTSSSINIPRQLISFFFWLCLFLEDDQWYCRKLDMDLCDFHRKLKDIFLCSCIRHLFLDWFLYFHLSECWC